MACIPEAFGERVELTQHRCQSFGNHLARLGRGTARTGEKERARRGVRASRAGVATTTRSTFVAVNSAAVEHRVRARLGSWPYEPDVVHLVLLDHHMVPDDAHIDRWITEARARQGRVIRTGALFPPSTPPFARAGFSTIDTLALFELDRSALDHLPTTPRPMTPRPTTPAPIPRVRRLRSAMLAEAAEIDRRAFPPVWGNDAAALADIITATPQHRARCVRVDGALAGFIISGRAGSVGYIQRLAVDPHTQRRGCGRLLVDDALRWMQRRGVKRALVNTAVDNDAASTLYRSFGFIEQGDRLQILERALR